MPLTKKTLYIYLSAAFCFFLGILCFNLAIVQYLSDDSIQLPAMQLISSITINNIFPIGNTNSQTPAPSSVFVSINPPLTYWNIDWDLILNYSNLIISNDDIAYAVKTKNRIQLHNYYDNKINQTAIEQLVSHGIIWNQPNYIGYCRAPLYPLPVFDDIFAETSQFVLKQNAITQTLLKVSEKNIDTYTAVTGVNGQHEKRHNEKLEKSQNKEKQTIGNNNNDDNSIGDLDDGIKEFYHFNIDSNIYQKWFDSSHIRYDLIRAEKMTQLNTPWRVTNIIPNIVGNRFLVEIILSRNAEVWAVNPPKQKNGENTTSFEKEKEFVDGLFFQRDVTNIDTRYLCVFNDGTVILSEIHGNSNGYLFNLIVTCDITYNINLIEKIFKNWQKNRQKNDNRVTNIGLTLFNLNIKYNETELLNEYLISIHTQLPICHSITVNKKPQIYNSEIGYYDIWDTHERSVIGFRHRHIDTKYLKTLMKLNNQTKATVGMDQAGWSRQHEKNKRDFPEIDVNVNADVDVNGGKEDKYKYKYFLSCVLVIHPISRSKPMHYHRLAKQMIDYMLFHGIDHFYIYDHISNRDYDNIDIFWDEIYQQGNKMMMNKDKDKDKDEKIKSMYKNRFTWIEWPVALKLRHASFIVAAYLDAMRRFKYETRYLIVNDIDEFPIILPKKLIPKLLYNLTFINDAVRLNPRSKSKQKMPRSDGMKQYFESFINNKTEDIIVPKRDDININIESESIPTLRELYYQQYQQNVENPFTISSLTTIVGMNSKIYDNFDANRKKRDGGVYYNDKDLQCRFDDNINNPFMYDTYMERQSCLHYRIQNNNGENIKIVEKPEPGYGFLTLNNASKEIGIFTNQKLIFDPKIFKMGYQHMLFEAYENSKINVFDHPNYVAFFLHTTDHLTAQKIKIYKRKIERFYKIVKSQCDWQNVVNYWNDRFLNSSYGVRWKNKRQVFPLFDEYGCYCYLKDEK